MRDDNVSADQIDEILQMIEGKMESGVSRLKVQIDEKQEAGTVKQQYHHGRCDVGSPWAKGTVSNCDL
ncbi:MAG: hypothetical protein K5739_04375 [Lachnospiraceae bacterium]|nr:hypothetical protein [Lachnospiraceae bacterium]